MGTGCPVQKPEIGRDCEACRRNQSSPALAIVTGAGRRGTANGLQLSALFRPASTRRNAGCERLTFGNVAARQLCVGFVKEADIGKTATETTGFRRGHHHHLEKSRSSVIFRDPTPPLLHFYRQLGGTSEIVARKSAFALAKERSKGKERSQPKGWLDAERDV
jgi:hypothetical protein